MSIDDKTPLFFRSAVPFKFPVKLFSCASFFILFRVRVTDFLIIFSLPKLIFGSLEKTTRTVMKFHGRAFLEREETILSKIDSYSSFCFLL